MDDININDFIDNLFSTEIDTTEDDIELFERLQHIPAWTEHDFDIELYDWQEKILSTDNRKVVMRIARRQGKCLHEDTLVHMANGSFKKIKDIKPDEWVIATYDQKASPRKVKELHNNGIQPCYKITTKTGREIISSSDHQFLKYFDKAPRWTRLKNIKIEKDKIAILADSYFYGNEELDDSYQLGKLPDNVLNFRKADSKIVLADYFFYTANIVKSNVGCKISFKTPEERMVVNSLLMRFGIFGFLYYTKQDHYILHIKDYYSVKRAKELFGVIANIPSTSIKIDRYRNIIWDTIESIEEIGDHQTYDLELLTNSDKDKNFIANGVVVHNSFIMLLKVLHFAFTHDNAAIYWISQSEKNLSDVLETKFQDILLLSLNPAIAQSITNRTKKPLTIEFGNGTKLRTAVAGLGSEGAAIRGLGERLSGTGRVCQVRVKKIDGYMMTIDNVDKQFLFEDSFYDHYILDKTRLKFQIDFSSKPEEDGSIILKLDKRGKFVEDDYVWVRQELDSGNVLVVLDEMDYISDKALGAIIPILEESPTTEVWVASTPKGYRSKFWKWCTAPIVDKVKNINTAGFVSYWFPQRLTDPYWVVRDDKGEPLLDHKGEILTQKQHLIEELGPLRYIHEIEADFTSDDGGAYLKQKVDYCFRGPLSNYCYSDIIDEKSPIRAMGVDWNKYSHGPEIVILQMEPESKITYVLARYQLDKAESEEDFVYTYAVDYIVQLADIYKPHYIYLDKGAGEQQVEILSRMAQEQKCLPSLRANGLKGINFASTIEVINYYEETTEKARIKSVMVDNLGRMLYDGLIIGRDDSAVIDTADVDINHYIHAPHRYLQQGFPISIPDQLTAMKVKGKDTKGYSFETSLEDHAHDALILAVQAIFDHHPDFADRMPSRHILLESFPIHTTEYRKFSMASGEEMGIVDEIHDIIIPFKNTKRGPHRTSRSWDSPAGRPSRIYW